ncbi:hypothetical protein JHK82_049553 [Glycine max]|uniref:Uncharacterized protein n=1 Tax=Glycine max TaxID=3847 RepID=A0A0R0F8A6_SOYBN|nr:hypothetical protein JHK86_049413 [Glycine max]KAG4935257.1 hypothetical protein JHK85_050176 [Glycine max]KAG5090775.1 hypothetical protein JHK82_049553 [Glycine max]KAG5093863.1 hypothetical protein JHK84_049451 [Glycine max]KAH1153497.1 hypothetical protein GYH30_049231 [Glycine max]
MALVKCKVLGLQHCRVQQVRVAVTQGQQVRGERRAIGYCELHKGDVIPSSDYSESLIRSASLVYCCYLDFLVSIF